MPRTAEPRLALAVDADSCRPGYGLPGGARHARPGHAQGAHYNQLNAPRQFPTRGSLALTLALVTSPLDPHPWQRPDDSGGPPVSASLVDPEDDVPSTNYGGDFETTAIPRNDSAKPVTPQSFGLLDDPEPIPYVQAGAGLAAGAYGSPAAPAEVPVSDSDHFSDPDRRGTQDFGLLVLRVAVGALLVSHGLQRMFGLWGGEGLDRFSGYLTEMGFRNADILSYVGAGGVIVAGVLLILGLFTPIAAAGTLAYLVPAILAQVVDARNDGRLSTFLTDGHESGLVLLCVVAAIVLIGPGRYGLDAGRGWAR
ncbi:MAG: DoxX family protein, partial [Actinomycetia bacterium]|nr:DoxX family protein [Actinomycetes bacterium]